MINPQKNIKFDKFGDTIEVIIRDPNFSKIFKKQVSINNKKELEILLNDLRNKGVDLIGIIKKKIISGDDWFI